ncbi:hypothetical protein DE146DRAFT_367839 [Phaeosphaeria sp. MPI-PUGE-AT-0046c]|nr:hypothetical protein DE146DRAFT_367839 [Phaeosphaeria sp. MPI-PUGE-AT-0046c]
MKSAMRRWLVEPIHLRLHHLHPSYPTTSDPHKYTCQLYLYSPAILPAYFSSPASSNTPSPSPAYSQLPRHVRLLFISCTASSVHISTFHHSNLGFQQTCRGGNHVNGGPSQKQVFYLLLLNCIHHVGSFAFYQVLFRIDHTNQAYFWTEVCNVKLQSIMAN